MKNKFFVFIRIMGMCFFAIWIMGSLGNKAYLSAFIALVGFLICLPITNKFLNLRKIQTAILVFAMFFGAIFFYPGNTVDASDREVTTEQASVPQAVSTAETRSMSTPIIEVTPTITPTPKPTPTSTPTPKPTPTPTPTTKPTSTPKPTPVPTPVATSCSNSGMLGEPGGCYWPTEVEKTVTYAETDYNQGGSDYIGNSNTGKFHYSWCSSVNQMNEGNKVYFSGVTRDVIIAQGYVPCKRCNP